MSRPYVHSLVVSFPLFISGIMYICMCRLSRYNIIVLWSVFIYNYNYTFELGVMSYDQSHVHVHVHVYRRRRV